MHLIADPVGSGHYYNGLREARAGRQAYDAAARQQQRDLSEKLTAA